MNAEYAQFFCHSVSIQYVTRYWTYAYAIYPHAVQYLIKQMGRFNSLIYFTQNKMRELALTMVVHRGNVQKSHHLSEKAE